MPAHKRANRVIREYADWVEVDISTDRHKGVSMRIDRVDWDRIQEDPSLGGVYAARSPHHNTHYARMHKKLGIGRGRSLSVHRYVLPDARVVDHRNGVGTDNRRHNLRPCGDNRENLLNTVRTRRCNTSGVTGVSRVARTGRWVARIADRPNGRVSLGTYDTFDEAVLARKAGEVKYGYSGV